jgi:hypothetical protein
MRSRISYVVFFLVFLGGLAVFSGTSQATKSNSVSPKAPVELNNVSITKSVASSKPKVLRKDGRLMMRRGSPAGRLVKAPPGWVCYGKSKAQYKWDPLGSMTLVQNGFCVSHRKQRITKDFGWHGYKDAWGPYCIDDFDVSHGWAKYPKRKYGKVKGSFGVSYPWGCAGVQTRSAKTIITWYGGIRH